MKKTNLFSGVKPALEDWNFERDAKELHIKKRIIDLTGSGTGILRKVADEIQVYVEDPNQFLIVKVKTGSAYIQGEKIEITEVQEVALDDVETEANIIYLTYRLINSSDPKALRHHYLSGQEYNVWQEDSFELHAVKESLYVQTPDKLKLARVAKVGNQLIVTHDYRTYLKISDQIMNTLIEGKAVLFKQPPPPIPTRVRLTTDFEEAIRSNDLAGLVSIRQAYIKIEFGDWGTGVASGNTFTKTTSQLNWTANEWAGQYLTDQNNDSYLVVSNTTTVLTLEPGATPVSGNFWLGPNARGYRFIIEPLHPETQIPISHEQAEITLGSSPVEMNYIFHGLTPDIKYRVRVASLGGWHQEEQSDWSDPAEIIAGGPKIIPDDCAAIIDNLAVSAHDLGCKITWDFNVAYADFVAGVEIIWSDDGSEPNFESVGYRKLFTDKNFVILPTELSTTDKQVIVKAKMRCVDKAGRHCTLPLAINPTVMKQYPGDLAAISARMEEVALARGGYSTLSARLEALNKAAVDWRYVRIVAKSGGHYTSIQAAIDAIPETDKYYIIFIMPGKYTENIDCGVKLIGLVGIGKVLIEGKINGGIGLFLVDNCRIKVTANSNYAVYREYSSKKLLLRDNCIDATNINPATDIISVYCDLIVRNCIIKTTVDTVGIGGFAQIGRPINFFIANNNIEVGSTCIETTGPVTSTIQNNLLKTRSANSILVYTPGIARVYNNVYNARPGGDGTIDYGIPVPDTSNIQNDNIEVVFEDDMFSNE